MVFLCVSAFSASPRFQGPVVSKPKFSSETSGFGFACSPDFQLLPVWRIIATSIESPQVLYVQ